MASRLILASKSPRRHDLLKQIGFDFEVIPGRVTEDFIETESPQEHVIRLAKAKAMEVAFRYPDCWVIAADTIVHINEAILGKPKNRVEAIEMLHRLSGQEHRVLTGFSVCQLRGGKCDKEVVQTTVKVKTLTTEEVEWYVQTGEPLDKAGGYAIQGIGSYMIESIQGSYTNVVGLPLYELIQMLSRLEAVTISKSGIQILP
jgi:septum formation protein